MIKPRIPVNAEVAQQVTDWRASLAEAVMKAKARLSVLEPEIARVENILGTLNGEADALRKVIAAMS